jgi:L-2-hydroxyglutarate oxidase LhgO
MLGMDLRQRSITLSASWLALLPRKPPVSRECKRKQRFIRLRSTDIPDQDHRHVLARIKPHMRQVLLIRAAVEKVMADIRAAGDDIVSYKAMQQKLMQEAMQKGADAILVENLDTIETGYTTVETKAAETKKRRTFSSTAVWITSIEHDRVIPGKLLKNR